AWLVGFGAGTAAFGFGTMAADGGRNKIPGDNAPLALGLAGAGLIVVAAPVWIVGSLPSAPQSARDEHLHAADEDKMLAGMVRTSLGTVGLACSVMVETSTPPSGGGGELGFDLGPAFAKATPLLISVGVLGAGVPLWITGAASTSRSPSLLLGPGGLRME